MKKINLCKCCGRCPVVLELDDGTHAIMEESDGTIIKFDAEQWRNLKNYMLKSGLAENFDDY